MTDRLLRFLPPLLFVAALVWPLGPALWRGFHPAPDLRWTVTEDFTLSGRAPDLDLFRYSTGFTMVLSNEGNAATGPVRLVLPETPVEVRPYLPAYMTLSESEAEEGHVVEISDLAPGSRATLVVYGLIDEDIRHVEAAGAIVRETFLPLPDFAPDPWLPNWAILSGALLLVGLALQNLRLRRAL